ncbi:MAG: amino acid ABC transporter permease [Pseudomonadota bacterium]|uniref:amino acid ABC transporter permease n=1 Tax=Roseovarius TaxID=74030 RepID=UPI0022A81FD9|nr:amino acid ABC transporter permease [Roseovarius sp. EGI FJ00037]MCZ0813898.1 amino acid ABC transporter permease [Roseovarius sp. EGI FJ00037]
MSAYNVTRMTWRAPVLALGLCVAGTVAAMAQQGGDARPGALATLVTWMPFILEGFVLNLVMSILAMAIATVTGVILGFMQISPIQVIRLPAKLVTHLFRNSPWLVILFAIMFLIPFQVPMPGGGTVMIPDWVKATIGFALPVMANISEILRGAVASIPSGQWESAESLAFTRFQTLRYIILPQCIRRMMPPWMNWYALLTLMTPMAAILGVNEALGNTQAAMEAAGARPELLVPFYLFLMTIFFVFIYPISIYTRRLERRFAAGS